MSYAGLKDDVIRMLTGERIAVDVSGFQNDLTQFKAKDDVGNSLRRSDELLKATWDTEALLT